MTDFMAAWERDQGAATRAATNVQSIMSGGPAQEVLKRSEQQWQIDTQQRTMARDIRYQTGLTAGQLPGLAAYYGAGGNQAGNAGIAPTAGSAWGIEAQQITLSRARQDQQTGFQKEDLARQQRQFTSGWNITDPALYRQQGWQREDMARGVARQGTQYDWQAQAMAINYGRQIKQADWTIADMGVQKGRTDIQFGWQAQDLGTQRMRSNVQFGWGQQDIGRQGQQGGLQFAWGMQDIDEQMRYATGRERRQLSKQRERQVIQYGFQTEGLEIEGERLGTKKKWSDADFDKEKSRLDERMKWSETDFEKEKGRAEERRGWITEDYTRESAQFDARRTWFDEDSVREKTRFELQAADAIALHVLEKANFEENFADSTKKQKADEAYLKKVRPLEDQARNLDHAHQVAALQESVLQADYDKARIKQYNELWDTLNQTDAKIASLGTGFNMMVDSISAYVAKTMLEYGGAIAPTYSGGGMYQGQGCSVLA